jgi:Protein of unknown function (DUF1706)
MTDRILPKSLDELLTDIEREWQALMRIVNQLTPKQMTIPDPGGWSPKDNLAHLSAWMNFMLKSYLGGMPAYLALGIEEQKLKGMSEDEENAIIFERNRARPTDEVISELKSTYQKTVKTLNRMGFSNLMKPFKGDNPQHRPVIEGVLGNTSEHFAEHRVIIERILNTRNS